MFIGNSIRNSQAKSECKVNVEKKRIHATSGHFIFHLNTSEMAEVILPKEGKKCKF